MKLSEEVKIRFNEKFRIGSTPWVREDVEVFVKKFVRILKKMTDSPNLLDIGCGNGWVSIYLAKQGIIVEGIDSSSIAIKEARIKAKKEKLSNVHFKVGDALDFPYPQKSFDAVFDRGLFHHQPKIEWRRYLNGLNCVLKDGGLFYLAVFSDKSEKEYYSLKKSGKLWHRRKSKTTGYWTYDHYFNQRLVKDIFQNHFKIIECKEEKSPAQKGSRLLKCIMEIRNR